MTKVVRFPHGRRMPAATIPREEFERLAELALDVVDRIVELLETPEQCDRPAKDVERSSPSPGRAVADP